MSVAPPSSSRVGVRELRANLADLLRRAERGERIVVMSNGAPIAQLGPLGPGPEMSLDDLVSAGLVAPPASARGPVPIEAHSLAVDQNARDVLDDLRGRQ